jgi:hypothetical protein
VDHYGLDLPADPIHANIAALPKLDNIVECADAVVLDAQLYDARCAEFGIAQHLSRFHDRELRRVAIPVLQRLLLPCHRDIIAGHEYDGMEGDSIGSQVLELRQAL